MATKVVITAKGADNTKQFTITNPNAEIGSSDASAFIAKYNAVYDDDLALAKIVRVDTSETTVYPAA